MEIPRTHHAITGVFIIRAAGAIKNLLLPKSVRHLDRAETRAIVAITSILGENNFENGVKDPEGDHALQQRRQQAAQALADGAVQPGLVESGEGVGPHRNDAGGDDKPEDLPGQVALGLKGDVALHVKGQYLGYDQSKEHGQEIGQAAVGQVLPGDAVKGLGHQGVHRPGSIIEHIVGVQAGDGLPGHSDCGGGRRVPDGPEKVQIRVDQTGVLQNCLQYRQQNELNDGDEIAHHKIGTNSAILGWRFHHAKLARTGPATISFSRH